MRNAAVISILAMAICMHPKTAIAQQNDYTLQSAYEKIVDWGIAATGYSEYKYTQSVKELKDSLVGSTIALSSLGIDGTRIKIDGGRASYSSGVVNPGNGYAFSQNFGFLGREYDGEVKIRCSTYYEIHSYREIPLLVKIYDTGDRLAMEVEGTKTIRATGRIRSINIHPIPPSRYPGVSIEIDLVSWAIKY